MYVIKRTDKDFGEPKIIHETGYQEVIDEARRLATKHAVENPEFTIYELQEKMVIRAKIEIIETDY